jgi:thioredoxin 1
MSENTNVSDVIEITDDDDLEDILSNSIKQYKLLYFTATWCGPCKKISPTIKNKFTKIDKLQIYKLDIDNCDDISQKYSITTVPTFILIKDKETKMKYSGSDSLVLLNNIKDIFNNN